MQVLTDTCARAGAPKWVSMSAYSSLPAGAVVGGSEPGHSLYICAALYNGVDHPGKFFRAGGKWLCHFGWGGQEKLATSFKVIHFCKTGDLIIQISN